MAWNTQKPYFNLYFNNIIIISSLIIVNINHLNKIFDDMIDLYQYFEYLLKVLDTQID